MEWVACVGIDWSDRKHDWMLVAQDGRTDRGVFESKPEEVHEWVRALRGRFPEGKILVALEQSRGALMYALRRYDFLIIVPINPRSLKAYRDSLRLSGAKDDPSDAELIRKFAVTHLEYLRVWSPDDPCTRKLRLLAEARRGLVDQRTAHTQALTAACKEYFPQVLGWFGGAGQTLTLAFLKRLPTLSKAKAARPETVRTLVRAHSRWSDEKIEALVVSIRSAVALTDDDAINEAQAMLAQSLVSIIVVIDGHVKEYDKAIESLAQAHPDREVFASFPGAGKVMAPRLMVAFGVDRARWEDAREIQSYSGIAPVLDSSGGRRWVHARWHCPTFLKQTFHEFAQASLPHSAWARAYYHQQVDRGSGHHAAIRSLAYRWIRILFRCWTTNELYDEDRYVAKLKQKGSPVIARLAA